MPDTPSITINKRFQYRGVPEVWSNTYHFSGSTPSSDSEWNTLALAIWGAEQPIVSPDVKYVGYLGYAAGNEHAVSMRDYIGEGITTPPGTGQISTYTPGDAAMWVRWRTPDRTSRGKPIYLRKYFHGVGTNGDQIISGAVTAATTYAGKMTDGTLPGNFRICGPQGAVAGAAKISPFITTRTLKRRGKRPSS